jgi:hypothetical protein
MAYLLAYAAVGYVMPGINLADVDNDAQEIVDT